MSGDYKRSRIGMFGQLTEFTAGLPAWRVTATGGSTTTMTIAAASGTAWYVDTSGGNKFAWDGATVFFNDNTSPTTDNRGEVATVRNGHTGGRSWAGDVLTVTFEPALPASVASGDTCTVLYRLPASEPTVDVGYENLPRNEWERDTLTQPSSLKGLEMCSGSFTTELWVQSYSSSVPIFDCMTILLGAIGQLRQPFLPLAGTNTSVTSSTA